MSVLKLENMFVLWGQMGFFLASALVSDFFLLISKRILYFKFKNLTCWEVTCKTCPLTYLKPKANVTEIPPNIAAVKENRIHTDNALVLKVISFFRNKDFLA